jgi:formamidopyrimidine-DNA glycosylase
VRVGTYFTVTGGKAIPVIQAGPKALGPTSLPEDSSALSTYNPHVMPELPEVENVRLTVSRHVLGRRVLAVHVRRADIVEGSRHPLALLQGCVIHAMTRHGKQLAIEGLKADNTPGPGLCVHLGMTGSLRCHPATLAQDDPLLTDKHVHLLWQLDHGGWMTFRDPRRFGGLWTYDTYPQLVASRWTTLGPDALLITPSQLHASLNRTRRPIKAALLDQAIVAGLGNIYVDETLFACAIHPLTPCHTLSREAVTGLVKAFKAILKRAINSGGSTIRNYANGEGQAGGFQKTLKVYGRSGQNCFTCSTPLTSQAVIGRTTTFCPRCQFLTA